MNTAGEQVSFRNRPSDSNRLAFGIDSRSSKPCSKEVRACVSY